MHANKKTSYSLLNMRFQNCSVFIYDVLLLPGKRLIFDNLIPAIVPNPICTINLPQKTKDERKMNEG
jgi:hypothetical protein